MTKMLTFLHTSQVHIATFHQLLVELAPSIPAQHIVDESLLEEARAFGTTPELTHRIAAVIRDAFVKDTSVMLCTCSTIGKYAEQAQPSIVQPVIRVDRAMAEQAVAIGNRITVAAALTSTLVPTCALLEEAARAARKSIILRELWCSDAWAYFEQGDIVSYCRTIANQLQQASQDSDVIVLAQASMAGAIAYCSDSAIPILSSPRLGLAAAIKAYQLIA